MIKIFYFFLSSLLTSISAYQLIDYNDQIKATTEEITHNIYNLEGGESLTLNYA